MSFFAILAIALALAMDAFAVSVSAAATLPVITWRHYFRLSFHFGLFQFLMPVIGWFLGVSVHSYIEAWDHWIAFGLPPGGCSSSCWPWPPALMLWPWGFPLP